MSTNRKKIDSLIDRWLARIPDADKAYMRDPQYHMQVRWMRRTFTALDLAMEDEGIPEQVRDRILRTLIHGAPDESEALQRMEGLRFQAEKLAAAPLVPEPWQERYPMWRESSRG